MQHVVHKVKTTTTTLFKLYNVQTEDRYGVSAKEGAREKERGRCSAGCTLDIRVLYSEIPVIKCHAKLPLKLQSSLGLCRIAGRRLVGD